jgi:hypothetical protein
MIADSSLDDDAKYFPLCENCRNQTSSTCMLRICPIIINIKDSYSNFTEMCSIFMVGGIDATRRSNNDYKSSEIFYIPYNF